MVHFSTLLFALSVAGSVTAAPTQLNKRIAQVISDSTTKWEQACNAANGGAKCNQVAVAAFGTLLAGAGPCDQQNNADTMMDLSKQLNSPQMIQLTQIFAQQPRNTPNSLSVVYCQQAPKNTELNGLFQCQFQGASPTQFTNNLKAGDAGTIPFGQKAILNPSGSCPAHTSGPIADGSQLVDLVSSPGVPSGSGAGNGNGNTPNPSPAPSSASPAATASSANTTPTPTPSPAVKSSTGTGSAPGFKAQNGKDAQALNQKFQSLTADSPCTDGEQACVQGQFGQCVGGKFELTPCSGGLTCTALPLVNKPGTSVTCDTQADAATRIAAALGSNSK